MLSMDDAKINSIENQQQILRSALEADGWRIIERTTEDLDWWAGEVWAIESLWRPNGLQAFVVFKKVDGGPLPSSNRRQKRYMWAVECSKNWPIKCREDTIAYVYLNHWKRKVAELIGGLAGFRKSLISMASE